MFTRIFSCVAIALLLTACGQSNDPLAPYQGFWDFDGEDCSPRFIHVDDDRVVYQGVGQGSAGEITALEDGGLRIDGRWLGRGGRGASGTVEVSMPAVDTIDITRRAYRLSPIQEIEMGAFGPLKRCDPTELAKTQN